MSWHLFKKILPYELVVILLFVICFIICRKLDITCLFYTFLKFPCPTCYMTRALIALLKGELNNYILYNVMAVPVGLVFIFELFSAYVNKYKSTIHILSIIILVINMIYYLFRVVFIFNNL
jgi:hypothetical protein